MIGYTLAFVVLLGGVVLAVYLGVHMLVFAARTEAHRRMSVVVALWAFLCAGINAYAAVVVFQVMRSLERAMEMLQ